MMMFVRNDYGVLQVSFAGLSVHLCDEASCLVFERIKKFLLNQSGENFSLDYFTLDCNNGVVSVYTLGHENFVPALTFSVRHLFRNNDSFLLRLYNIFAPKRRQLRYESDGKPVFGSINFHSGNGLGADVFKIR